MNRRTYLTGSAVLATGGMGGCTGLSTPEDGDADPPSGDGTNDDGDDGDAGDVSWIPADDLPAWSEPTVVDFDTAPVTAAWSAGNFRTDHEIHVQLDFDAPATAEAPAQVSVSIVNTQEFEQTVETRWVHVFDDAVRGRTDDRSWAYLVPTSEHPFADIDPDIARDEDGRWRLERRPGTWYPATISLPAESGIQAEYYLVGDTAREEPPIQSGTYRFGGGDGFELTVWRSAPGPGVDSRFDDEDPSPLPNSNAMAWAHLATPEDLVFLEPDTERVELPDTIELSFHNYADAQASGNPYYWRLYKLLDDAWQPIVPWMWNTPLTYINPGGQVDTQLALFHGDGFSVPDSREVGYLGGGTYAYETGFRLQDETHAAMFEVEAPPLAVEPNADVTTEEDGETLIATHPAYGEGDRPTTVTVSVADDTGTGDRTLIPEQLFRQPFVPYRTALPLFESGIRTVRVRLDREHAEWFPSSGTEEMTYEYREDTYRSTVLEE